MLIEEPPVVLCLFAHQDDEFGIFQKIIDEREKGHRVCCAYLTNGDMGTGISRRRNFESLSVLRQLGVQEQDVFFIGDLLSIPDAKLIEHLESAANWIRKWFSSFSQVSSIYVPAWEGGHHDHDALHAITVMISKESDLLSCVRQFPLYNGYGCVGPLFRVCAPIPLNGTVEKINTPWINRFQFLRYCLSYPSQAKTWMGLFPFVVFHYLVSGKQLLQPVSVARIQHRPHNGKLYYERRGFSTWEEITDRLSKWYKK